MEPLRFLRTADRLKDTCREEDSRTSISRSYYAIIHFIKDILSNAGVSIGRRQTHKLYNLFLECRNSNVRAIGLHISSLHDERIKADYEFSKKVQKQHAKMNYKLACQIERDFTLYFDSAEKEDILNQARNLT